MTNGYKINGTVTFEEYLECHKVLAAKRRLWIRGIITVYGAGMLVFGMFVTPSKPDLTFVIFGAIMIAYGFILSPIQFRVRMKRNWERYPAIRKEFDMVVTEEGVDTKDDKGNPSHLAWASFYDFRESESLFMLYLSPLLPLFLPKRLVPEADLSGLRELLSSAIGKKTDDEKGIDPDA